ncbi:MAG: RibD family protein [Bacteroidales bacterium]
MNRRFFTFLEKKRPYVILKWAQTQDGFLDVDRAPGDPVGTNWITDDVCRTLVHKWRAEEAGIMAGTNTIIADDPYLNLRRWSGAQPVRITIDRNNRIPANAHILDGSQDTIVFSGSASSSVGRTRRVSVDPSYGLEDLLEEMRDQKIISLLVEGGAQLHASFLRSGLWDEARVFTGRISFSQGVRAPRLDQTPREVRYISQIKLEYFTKEG